MFRTLTGRQHAVDVSIAAACFLLRMTIPIGDLPLWLVVAGMAASLAIRRLSPGLALALAWLVAIGQMIALLPPDVSNLAILAVLYATARYGGSRVRWAGLVSAGVGALVATFYFLFVSGRPQGAFVGSSNPASAGLTFVASLGFALVTFGLSWTLGLLARTWVTARDNRRQRVVAERAVVVEQERNRIARDMHDVVAHSLAVVIAQADGARYAGDKKSTDAALTTISSTARDALADVRLLLSQLRHSEGEGPQPVLADLDRLVAQLRASGLAVDLVQHGEPLVLASGQQLALYRIVQEALTNALRHGDTSEPVTVDLEWLPDAADATITNALAAASTAGPAIGHGLAGMRERALLVGGTFSAEPDGPRFVVHASIPASS